MQDAENLGVEGWGLSGWRVVVEMYHAAGLWNRRLGESAVAVSPVIGGSYVIEHHQEKSGIMRRGD